VSVQDSVLQLTSAWQKAIAANLAARLGNRLSNRLDHRLGNATNSTTNLATKNLATKNLATKNLATKNLITPNSAQINLAQINLAATNLTVILLCLYICEVRQVIPSGELQAICAKPNVAAALGKLWQLLCQRSGQKFALFSLPPDLPAALLKGLISSLYYPNDYTSLAVNILGQVYEQSLRKGVPHTRKSGGIYYTPQPIVDYMVSASFEQLGDIPANLQILDPACGGGTFLLTAYDYLLKSQSGLRSHQDWLKSICGVDIDPIAVNITRLSLWLKLLECSSVHSYMSLEWLPDLSQTIQAGDAIGGREQQFDWQTSFPQAAGFDLVLGNPPYLDSELMATHYLSWRTYCASHYQTATGNWDLFCVFIEKALQLCRTGGVTSLIVPNKLLSADYAGAARLLLSQTELSSIRDYTQIQVFDAAVYPIVYVAKNVRPREANSTRYEQMQTLERIGLSYPIHLPAASSQPWCFGIQAHSDLIQHLEQFSKLGDLVTVTGAATVSEAYQLQPLIADRGTPNLRDSDPDLRLINSGTIDRYRLLWGQKPLRYLGQIYQYPIVPQTVLHELPAKRLQQAQQPKIIVAGMGLQLEAVLDQRGGILAGKSTSVIGLASRLTSKSNLHPYYLLGLLNSHLLSVYLLTRFSGNRLKGGYLRIGPPQLRQLPIVVPCSSAEVAAAQAIIEYVEQRLHRKNDSNEMLDSELDSELDLKIDAAVYQLYQIKSVDIELLS
jgi:hypothetical protein